MTDSCPECGEACYCGGDIDDIFFEDSEEELNCGHCLGKAQNDLDDYDDYISDDPGGTP